MRLTDLIALIGYPLLVIAMAVIVYSFSESFIFQVKQGVLSWYLFWIGVFSVGFAVWIGMLFYNRILIATGQQMPSPVSSASAIVIGVMSIAAMIIAVMIRYKLTNLVFPIPGARKERK